MTAPGKSLVVIPPEIHRVRQLLDLRRQERDHARYWQKRTEDELSAMTKSRERWFGTAIVVGLLALFSVAGGTVAALDALADMEREVEGLKAENAEQDHVIEGLTERIDRLAARMPTI